MLRIKKVSDVVGKQVYTSEGDLFGQVEELNFVDNKIEGWRIKIGSGFISMLGGAKGVIVPHQFIRAVGDVVIVNKNSLPVRDGEDVTEAMDLSSGMAQQSNSDMF
jgi:sporulation protein YlmC with PRC-barrel domain